MADYVTVRDPDPFVLAAENAVTALRNAMPHVALPPKRVDLERAASDLERELRRRAT